LSGALRDDFGMKAHEYQTNYEIEAHYWWFVGVRRMVRRLLGYAGSQERLGRVLDVGCGTGGLLDELTPLSDQMCGLDLSKAALRFSLLRGHANLIQADAVALPFPDGYFDVVTAIGVIEHLEDDAVFIQEITRVLKTGGVLILLTSSFPFLWSMHDTANQHMRRYYLSSLHRRLNQAGLKTKRFSHLNFILFPLLAPALMIHRLIFGTHAKDSHRILPRTSRLINALLARVLFIEARLMQWVRLPWGISMIGSFEKS